MRKFWKKQYTTILLFVILGAGIFLLLYPTVSDRWNRHHQSVAVAAYQETVGRMDEATYEEMLAKARAYNAGLLQNPDRWQPDEQELADYASLLDVSGTGVMATVEIPSIHVNLPVYHGVDEAVLQVAVGHIPGTSLPIGGESTHAVLSGHRGLPSAQLFTRLDELTEGDIFQIHVLNETLTYSVDQIHIVEPEDLTWLQIEPGQDLCTLVTCTPYGVNTHRLLVRGHRVENPDELPEITADAVQAESGMVALGIAAGILLLGAVIRLGKKVYRRSRKQGRKKER